MQQLLQLKTKKTCGVRKASLQMKGSINRCMYIISSNLCSNQTLTMPTAGPSPFLKAAYLCINASPGQKTTLDFLQERQIEKKARSYIERVDQTDKADIAHKY